MNLSAPFVARPVATTLLTIGLALAGIVAFFLLPVSPLPQVDFPTISVQASLPGASPETMATSVATPLERHLGQIADVTEMTSQSSVGNSRITLQFGLDRDIDGAARDVQAAINAARADLPAALKSNPTYRKVNPADAPVMILALTSPSLTPGQIYDSASTILAQKISQVQGVGQVTVGGGSLPAVRVELNPQALFKYGIGLEDVRAALAAANANSPKGALEENAEHFQIYTNDQAKRAVNYADLLVAYRNNAAVRLSDIAEVKDSVEDLRNYGIFNGQAAIMLIITKQPGANIIQTVDAVTAMLPQLRASIPSSIDLTVAMDRTKTIRGSLSDVERTLCISTALVILVVFLFLRNAHATLIPTIAVPVSLLGTFGVMYMLGYSLDNLSLMAMTIATGFVVDDAIVVLENITRHIEAGMTRMQATLLGAREVGFTVLSMSLSLIAVFVPILLMGGIVGRLFREFAVTLSVAILISLMISLTTTPMMCARILKHKHKVPKHGHKSVLTRIYDVCENAFTRLQRVYDHALVWALKHGLIVMFILAATVALNIYLFTVVPKGFFPQQDTGQLQGGVQADQTISFQLMKQKMQQFVGIVKADPAVDGVAAFTGGGTTNSGFVFVTLKPLSERKISADQIIGRLRGKLSHVPGASLFLQASQDIRVGGRAGNAQYQYTLQADNLSDLRVWTPKLANALKTATEISDVNSDQQDSGLETELTIDRDTASRLGLQASQIDNTLYDAFGQRQVSVIYNALNQYHVVMEVAPQFWQSPDTLKELYVSTSGGAASGTQTSSATVTGSAKNLSTNSIAASGHTSASTGAAISTAVETMIPLAAFSSYAPGTTPLSVNHQGHFAANTISFNVPPGKSLSDATKLIGDTITQIGMPTTIHGTFQGTAQAYQASLDNEPILLLAAVLAVYIVLGILYESYIHPLTILSTLPSAGVGALLGLILFSSSFTEIGGHFNTPGIGEWFTALSTLPTFLLGNAQLNLMGIIGIILLIGIVKKNAIMMIDFALDAERNHNFDSQAAIYRACLLRFRPIMMTTTAAMLGAMPLAIGFGEGSELRRPLGVSIVGGLFVSQILTLFTTPIIYLYLDRLGIWLKNFDRRAEFKNYISRHWHGELTIARSFWLSGFLANIFFYLPILVLLHFLLARREHITDPMLYGSMVLFLGLIIVLLYIVDFAVKTWWTVGVWRSCDKHDPQHTSVYWITKITLVINILTFLGIYCLKLSGTHL